VVEHTGPAKIVLRNGILELSVRPNLDAKARERALHQWYRAQLRELIPPLLAKWEAILGVEAADWGIKKMKTKWGACSVASRRIWLNLELAKKPVHCLEYLIVHELLHFAERHHNNRFVSLMDRHLPDWRLRRARLNAAPLAHESWSY
jgi:predicted metal-dependent hydrolase